MIRSATAVVLSILGLWLSGCSSDLEASGPEPLGSGGTTNAPYDPNTDPNYPQYPVVTTTQSPCPQGDDFCRSQTVKGGDFSNSFCKYWLTNEAYCQGPPGSTDPEQLNVPCECPCISTVSVTSTTTTLSPSTTESPSTWSPSTESTTVPTSTTD